MIQRLQTIFLLLSIVLLGLYLWMPVWGMGQNAKETFWKGYEIGESIPFNEEYYYYYINAIIAGIAIGITLVAIFLFKKRPLQILFCWFATIFTASSVAYVFYTYQTAACQYNHLVQKTIDCESILTPWNLLAIGAILCQFAAIIYIRKDEALVKSMDRLR